MGVLLCIVFLTQNDHRRESVLSRNRGTVKSRSIGRQPGKAEDAGWLRAAKKLFCRCEDPHAGLGTVRLKVYVRTYAR